MNYETIIEMELALSRHFNRRANLIVPNISWGLNLHECDLLILSKAGFATEVEIKTSKADLKKDKEKQHGHYSEKIRRLYFAVPEKISEEFALEHIPERAGLIVVNKKGYCFEKKKCAVNTKARAFSDEERFKMARLGALRIWNLKLKLFKYSKDRKELLSIIKELKKENSLYVKH